MHGSEKIFLGLCAVALVAILIFEAGTRGITVPVASVEPSKVPDLPPDIGLSYLTMNTPNFNPGPPVYNVMPKMAAAVATVNSGGNSSCNSCG